MRKQRVNLCFNEQDNPEVISLIEASGTKRPSGLIHDLIRKGLILEKLISSQVLNGLVPIIAAHSEEKGKALLSEKADLTVVVPPAKPELMVGLGNKVLVATASNAAPVSETPQGVALETQPQPCVAKCSYDEDGAVVVSMTGLSGLGTDY